MGSVRAVVFAVDDRVHEGRHSLPFQAGAPARVYRTGQRPFWSDDGDASVGESVGRTYPGPVTPAHGVIYGEVAMAVPGPELGEWEPSVGPLADECYSLIHEGWNASSVSPLVCVVYGVDWWLVVFYPFQSVVGCRGGEDEVAAGGVGSG